MHPSTIDALYGSSLSRRFQLAHRLFTESGERFLSLAALQNHLKALRLLQDDVRRCMEEAGMPTVCTNCARSSATGGCCSHAMTNENDAVLLLFNLLAGGPVELQRRDGGECLFLGEAGCSLQFKPYFCLNYLCRQLRQQTPPAMLLGLERATGLLLQEQYAVEQFLLGLLDGMLQNGCQPPGKDATVKEACNKTSNEPLF